MVKKYLATAIKDIQATGQTIKPHTNKVVQMHYLSRNIAARMEKELKDSDAIGMFGQTLKYNKVFFGMIGDECITIEEFIEGRFKKYVNNNGNICGDQVDHFCQKAECLVHYSYYTSKKELMLLDVQGCNNILFDPEIASKSLFADNQELLFCTGNLTETAMTSFIQSHKCNFYCQLLDLPSLSC